MKILDFTGYYADPELQCQAYHVCLLDPHSGEISQQFNLCKTTEMSSNQDALAE